MGTYYPAPTKPTPVDTNAAHILAVPAGGPASGGGTASPGSAAAPDHVHAGTVPQATVSQRLAAIQATGTPDAPASVGWRPNIAGSGAYGTFGPALVSGRYVLFIDTVVIAGGAWATGCLMYDLLTDAWSQRPIANWQSVISALGNTATSQTPGNFALDDGRGRLWLLNSWAGGSAFGYIDTADWSWHPVAGLPAAFTNQMLAACLVGSTIYLMVGPYNGQSMWAYDTTKGAAGTWTQQTLTGRTNTNAPETVMVPYGGLLYIIDGTANMKTWDPATGAWTQLGVTATSPGGNSDFRQAFVHGNVATILSTLNTNSNNTVAQFNLASLTWIFESAAIQTALGTGAAGANSPTDHGGIDLGPNLVGRFNWSGPAGPPGTTQSLYQYDTVGRVWAKLGAALTVAGPLSIGGHLLAGGAAPAVAAGAALGTAPPAPTTTGNDTRGTVGMGTGTATAAGNAAVVTFAAAFGAAPVVHLTALNAATAALQPYVAATAAGSFTIGFGVAPAVSQAAGTYQLAFHVIG